MNSTPNTSSQTRDLRGEWGGEQIAMEITDAGATIEYPCAHGRVTEKITPGADGNFEAKGTYTRERGGPIRRGEDNDQPAVYRGAIKDDTLTLTVELTRNSESVGPFTLTKGKTGRVRKCL